MNDIVICSNVVENRELAKYEMSLLQDIIGRQDDLKSKCKGFSATIFSALTIAFLSHKIVDVSGVKYVLCSAVIACLFLLIESIYGVTEMNAEARVRVVEKFLSGGSTKYNGPAISESLHKKLSSVTLTAAMRRERTYGLYLSIILISVIVAILS